jgi:hypothetical protein
VAAFSGNVAELLANEALTTAMGGDPVRDAEADRFSCTLRCHAESGEIYYVSFARDRVSVSSYSDDALLAMLETWADTVAALA